MSTTCLHLVPTLKICDDDKMLNPGTSIVGLVLLLPTKQLQSGVHKSSATKFCMVVPNGSCVMELALHHHSGIRILNKYVNPRVRQFPKKYPN